MRISDWSSDVCSSDLSRAGTAGSGSAAHSSAAPSPLTACCLRMLPPWTVTKLGQKPFTQEKSLLQDDWSMARLRPNSVSTGTTRSEEHQSELQSLLRISYAVFCLKKKTIL